MQDVRSTRLLDMKQRDALLDGAKKCLVEKGFHGTTARDIAAASGAHLGSIGYHFGSKDRLMSLAALELSSQWGDTMEQLARSAGGETPGERLITMLSEVLASLPQTQDVHSVSLQAFVHAQFDDDLRRELAAGTAQGRAALAALLEGRQESEGPDRADDAGLGSLSYALVTGLVIQSLVDPEHLPSPAELSEGLTRLGTRGSTEG